MKPSEFSFAISVSPLIQLYDPKRKIERFFLKLEESGLPQRAESVRHFLEMVDTEIKGMDLGFPFKLTFVDGEDRMPTDYPEYVPSPILVVYYDDGSGHILPIVQ